MATTPKNDNATGGIEKRGKTFYVVGHALAFGIAVAFLAALAIVFVSGELWRTWLYQGTVDLSNTCTYSASYVADGTATPSASARPVTLPHRGKKLVVDGTPGDEVRLTYTCQTPEIGAQTKGVSYAHLGWIGGDKVTVAVSGRALVNFSGTDKVVVPVSSGDVITVAISHPTLRIAQAGFIGTQYPIVASDYQTNNRLFGIDSFLMVTRALTYLIPVVSLGMVLGLAWFGGFRSRNLTMAMTVLAWAVIYRGSTLYIGIVDTVGNGPNLFRLMSLMGFGIAMVLFHMEVGRVRPKWIYPIARWSTVGLGLLFLESMRRFSPNLQTGIYTVGYALIGVFAVSVAVAIARKGGLQNRIIFLASLLSGVAHLYDAYARSRGEAALLSNNLQIFLPLYVALFLQSSMAFSDKKFWKERHHNQELSQIVDLESARVSTLSRFLPKSLVDRFQTRESIDQSLARVLTPRIENIAVIQADMRGFTKLIAGRNEGEVIHLLQTCFGPVVDHAQKFAMVKLIGDCLFAFVEPTEGNKSPVDQALEIAAHLIRQVEDVSRRDGLGNGLRFGIGITYGKAVVGNLSAESCIDYTAIGEPVNLAARLEELTKNPVLSEQIGANGILMSEEAAAALGRYSIDEANFIDLENIKVRSFGHVARVRYLTSQECLDAVFTNVMAGESADLPPASKQPELRVVA